MVEEKLAENLLDQLHIIYTNKICYAQQCYIVWWLWLLLFILPSSTKGKFLAEKATSKGAMGQSPVFRTSQIITLMRLSESSTI